MSILSKLFKSFDYKPDYVTGYGKYVYRYECKDCGVYGISDLCGVCGRQERPKVVVRPLYKIDRNYDMDFRRFVKWEKKED